MLDRQDAFGHAIYDRFKGRDSMEIIERDDGYVDFADNAGYFAEARKWNKIERQAIAVARGRVLDIGCGAGRVCWHLQKKGLEVLGTDISPLALKICRERGVKKTRLLSITELRRGIGLGRFDTIIMFGNNFGLFGSPARARRLLRRFHGITSDDALIIGQTVDPYRTDDPDHLRYHRFNRSRGRMAGQLRLRVLYRSRRTPWFDYLFVSPNEMRGILEGTGWRVRKIFDSLPGGIYIAIIEKER